MCERLFLKMVFLKGKTKSTFRAICLIKYSHSGSASNTSWQCISFQFQKGGQTNKDDLNTKSL